MKIRHYKLYFILSFSFLVIYSGAVSAGDHIPAVPLAAEQAGNSEAMEIPPVLRVLCPGRKKSGSGFLHKSGKVISAYHVISECAVQDIILVDSHGQNIRVSKIAVNADLDLALMTPKQKIKGQALEIGGADQYSVGAQVITWGYPNGYRGPAPLFSSAYLAGMEKTKGQSGNFITRYVVNGALNSGSSGGPLLGIDSKSVIGVVISKAAPLPSEIEEAMKCLKGTTFGIIVPVTKTDGSKANVSQCQLIGDILEHITSHAQTVISYAVPTSHLKSFLRTNGVIP